MKKLLFTSLLGLGLLIPVNFSAATNTNSYAKELLQKKPKKIKSKSKKSRKNKSTGSRYSGSQSRKCTYNGQQLYVGSRGGCYYYSGSSKQYVDRSYCANCN